MMKIKMFHLGDVLSVTAVLVSPRCIDGVLNILNFMTGDNLSIHQIPYAIRECRPYLLKQFPQLANVDASGVNDKNHIQWLAKQVAKYGEEFKVKPIPKDAHQSNNPIAEAVEMMGGIEKVIVVQTD